MTLKTKLLLAITGHGFGHATRSLLVGREMLRLRPELDLTVSTTVEPRFFGDELAGKARWRPRAYEPGTAQRSCFEVDVGATMEAYVRYVEERPRLLSEERRYLAEEGFHAVVADIPAIPLRAASDVGVPSAGMWNFTWDFILEPILTGPDANGSRLASVPGLLREDYALAGLHLRLPFSPTESPFSNVEPAPLVGRAATLPRDETLHAAGLEPVDPRPVVLVAMGGWECSHWGSVRLVGCEGFRFLVVGDVPIETPAEVRRIPARLGPDFAFSDLVRAADVVVSKPGYGVASECAVNRTPLLGVERRGFLEAAHLRRDLEALGPFVEMPIADFFSGRWREPLDAILERGRSRPWEAVPMDGAERVARRLLEHFGI